MIFLHSLSLLLASINLSPLHLPTTLSLLLLGFTYVVLPLMQSFGSFHFSFPVSNVVLDETTVLLCYITLLVLFISFVSHSFTSRLVVPFYTFVGLFGASFLVFSTSSFLMLYIAYEASLVPISYAIIKWGSYPDRGYSALIMLLFTSLFTFPMMLVVMHTYLELGHSFLMFVSFNIDHLSLMWSLWLLFSFSVKLPIYGLHFWLPLAHVEAPTFGSMILAGLLLKMGGCGLMRILPMLSSSISFVTSTMLSYVMASVVICAYLCAHQSDMKRLVAYSSVVHMSLIVALFMAASPLAYKALLMMMIFHGLSSPLLFFVVGFVYNLYGTRLIYMLRNLTVLSPLAAFMVTLSFLMSVPVPPMPSFVAEVLLFLSIYPLSSTALVLTVLSVFVVMIYNLAWYLPLLFDTNPHIKHLPLSSTPLPMLVMVSFPLVATLSFLVFFLF